MAPLPPRLGLCFDAILVDFVTEGIATKYDSKSCQSSQSTQIKTPTQHGRRCNTADLSIAEADPAIKVRGGRFQ